MKSLPIIPSLAVVSAIGLGISVYMTWIGLTGSTVAGCDGGLFNCDHVLTSRWSKFLGIPVGLPAAGLYTGLLVLLALIGRTHWRGKRERVHSGEPKSIEPKSGELRSGEPSLDRPAAAAWRLVSLLSWTAGLAALWFLGLQIFVLGHLCVYCVIAHSCSLTVWGLVQFAYPWETSVQTKNALIGATMVGILIAGQALGKPPQTFRIEEFSATEVDASPIDSTETMDSIDSGDVFDAPGDGGELFDAPVFDSPVFDAPIFDAPETEAPVSDARSSFNGAMPANVFPNLSPNFALQMAGWFSPSISIAVMVDDTTQAAPTETSDPPTTPTTTEPERRLVPVSGGKRNLDIDQWPLWGDRDAKYVIAKLFDYTCSHCRETHHAIEAAAKQLDGQLAVVVLPTPLHKSCNSASQTTDPALASRCVIAKLSVTMWLADASQFTEFHNWMFQQERTADETRNHIIGLVGIERFNEIHDSKTPTAYVDKNIFLYKESGAGTLPKLIFPTTTVVGEISSGNTLANLIREKL